MVGPVVTLKLARRVGEVPLGQVGDDHLHARRQEHPGHAEADSAGAACDEGDLVLDVLHPRVLLWPLTGRTLVRFPLRISYLSRSAGRIGR